MSSAVNLNNCYHCKYRLANPVRSNCSLDKKIINIVFHIFAVIIHFTFYHLVKKKSVILVKENQKINNVITIQNAIRSKIAHSNFEKLREVHTTRLSKVILIQSLIRKKLKQVRLESLKKENLIIKIQSAFRMYVAKLKYQEKRLSSLDYSLFEKIKLNLEDPLYLHTSEQATIDDLNIYRPNDLSIEIKQEGNFSKGNRLSDFETIHKFIKERNYSSLIAPKARPYQKLIIQESYPAPLYDVKHQMSVYLENLEKFNLAVEEFTELCCHFSFDFLRSYDPFQRDSKTPYPAYNVLALFVDNHRGRIGIRDLIIRDGISFDTRYYNSLVLRLMHLFPYHINEVVKVIAKYDATIYEQKKLIISYQDCTIKKYEFYINSHLNLFNVKKISIDDPFKITPITKHRREQISQVLEIEINKLNDSSRLWGDFLGEDSIHLLEWFRYKIFPKVFEAIQALFHEGLRLNAQSMIAITTQEDLLNLRTLIISNGYLDRILFDDLKMLHCEEVAKSNLLYLIQDLVLKELKAGGEIAQYGPYGQGVGTSYVFC